MKISIVGATAYTSRELIRLLARHPEAELVHLGGRREGRPTISGIFPDLLGICDLPVLGLAPTDAPLTPDLAFFTLPHGVAQQHVPHYLDAGVRCIDFSADYRFRDVAAYEAYYGEHTDRGNLAHAVFGLPELFRDRLRDARLVANPGCYPTAVVLALAPLLRAGLVDAGTIVVDAKSGVSGRGNKPSEESMFCECNEDVRAYSVTGHRHEPEMEFALQLAGASAPRVTFIPHLVPMDRGILATVTARLARPADTGDLTDALLDAYADEPFVRVRRPDDQPRTRSVALTNYCDLAAVVRRGEVAVVTAAIDNLMKGASSQAVQNMNAMFGLDETLGLL
jgi:N-acetyl-gamma-glutamyl-phosphate reductase